MLEPLRSRYLDVLGIDQYVPRVILPAAKASIECEWLIEPETEAAAAVTVAATLTAPSPSRMQPTALDIDVPSAPSRAVAERMPLTVKAPAANAAAAPQFALSIAIADGVLLLDDAPTSSAERGEFQKLIGNFLFALQRLPVQFGFDIFLWPMLKSSPVSQDATAARDALNAYLQKQIQQREIQRVLILGATAQQWCTLENQLPLHCVRATSLLQCLREPLHKRVLWHEMREVWNAAPASAVE